MKMIIALISGISIGIAATVLLNKNISQEDEEKPLYWAAPMDPNFRRDGPGKSPMGMDLIPVYEEKETSSSNPGLAQAIFIKSEVQHNLGVKTDKATLKTLSPQFETVGYVGYNEDTLIHIHPRVEGWIEKLYVKAEGNPVEKGKPLYELYSPELVIAQEEYILALEQNNARLIRSATDRLKALHVPTKTIQRLSRTKTVNQHITFYSPQNGVIDNLNIREGYFVKPDKTLMSIGALDKIWVEAEIFETLSSKVKPGLKAQMAIDALPGKSWQGKVDYIYPTLNEVRRTLRVRMEFDNSGGLLKPNMYAKISLFSQPEENILTIPKPALIRTGKMDRVVLALEEGHFKSVQVSVGSIYDDDVEILSGLKEGDSIVTSGQFLIDSESSKTSDFIRHEKVEKRHESAWVEGVIEDIDKHMRKVTLSHGPIDEWDMMGMTMIFSVDERINIQTLSIDAEIEAEITRTPDNQYSITAVKSVDEGDTDD